LQFLSSHQKEEMSVTNLCHEYGNSRLTSQEGIKRYDEVGPTLVGYFAQAPVALREG